MTNDDASRISPSELERLSRATVLDHDGDKIGPVEQIYVHDTSGRPSWASVRTGLFRTREALVPLDGVDLNGDEIRVPFAKDVVKDSPKVEADDHISPSEENELHAYYRAHGWGGGAAVDSPAAEGPREAALSEPSAPGAPTASEPLAAEATEVPEAPDVSETPQIPEVPEAPERPESPRAPVEPQTPLSPSAPSAPEAPSTPSAPGTPSAAGAAGVVGATGAAAAADEFVTPGNSTLSDSPVEPSRDVSEVEDPGFGTDAATDASDTSDSPATDSPVDDSSTDGTWTPDAPGSADDLGPQGSRDSADGTWSTGGGPEETDVDEHGTGGGPESVEEYGSHSEAHATDPERDDELESAGRPTGTQDIPQAAVTRGSYETPYPGDALSGGSGGRRISAFDEVTDGGYSIGSAAPIGPGVQPMGHPVRAWEDTKTFRVGPEGDWEREPDVWFMDEQAAGNAGFRPSEY